MPQVKGCVIEECVLKKYKGSDSDIVIPEGVTSIRYSAFENCCSLTSVTIPDGVTSIGNWAFQNCKNLKSITIPDSVTSIGKSTFSGCSSLTNITIPDSVTDIGDGAFFGCSSLTSITIPKFIKRIEGSEYLGTFSRCSSLTSVTIPDSVTGIGDRAFSGCSSLTSITISQSVSNIASSAFTGCKGLADASGAVIVNGILFNYFGQQKHFIVPDGIKYIGTRAFADCDILEEITIPEGLIGIGNGAFCGCGSLRSIEIPSGITSIGENLFKNCYRLESITIPDSLTSIGISAFEDCRRLKAVYAQSLKGWLNIHFSGYLSNPCNAGAALFIGGELATHIVAPDSVTSIGEWAFLGCSSLTSITIPDSVTSIGDSAFYKCNNLASVTIPDSVMHVGEEAFYGCTHLSEISISGSISEIENGAFERLPKLRFIVRGKPGPALLKLFSKYKSLRECAVYSCETLCSDVPVYARKKMTVRVADEIMQGHGVPDEVYKSYLRYITAHVSEWFDGSADENLPVIQLIIREKLIKITEIDSLIKSTSKKKNAELINMLMEYQQDNFGLEDYDRQTEKEFHQLERDVEVRADKASQEYINAMWSVGRKNTYATSFKDASKTVVFPSRIGKTVVTGVADEFAFRGEENACQKVEEIIIPEGYTYIGKQALNQCTNLKRVSLPASLVAIGDYAFEGCSSLESLSIPNGVTSIGHGALFYCDSLVSVAVPDSVREYDDWFWFDTSGSPARRITLPGSIVLQLIKNNDIDDFADAIDFGFDHEGKKRYNIGGNMIVASITAELGFRLFDENKQKEIKTFPRKSDDPVKAEACAQAFADLKKAVVAFAKYRTEILHVLHNNGTYIEQDLWRKLYAEHPFICYLSRMMVWQDEFGRTFMISGTGFIDSKSNPYLPQGRIRLAHVLDMRTGEIEAWRGIIARSGIKQLFEQIWEPIIDWNNESVKKRYDGATLSTAVRDAMKKAICQKGIKVSAERDRIEPSPETGYKPIYLPNGTLFFGNVANLKYHVNEESKLVTLGELYTDCQPGDRSMNAILMELDKATLSSQISRNNDDALTDQNLSAFTAAQIATFLNIAIDNKATRCTARLLDYKNTHFPEFASVNEFSLDW